MAGMASAASTLEWVAPNGTASPWETASNWTEVTTGAHTVPTNIDTARIYNAFTGSGFTDSNVTINTTTAICQKLQMKYLVCKLTIPTGMKLTTTGSVEMQIGTSSQLDIQAGATMDACTKANTATATFKLSNDAAAASTDTVNVLGILNVISQTPANGTSELDICNVALGTGTGTVNINNTGVVNVDAYNIGTAGTGRIIITIGGTMTIKGDVTARRRRLAWTPGRWPVDGEASMGPSMIVDGDSRRGRSRARRCPGFNGAVDDRRRRRATSAGRSRVARQLQWGRR